MPPGQMMTVPKPKVGSERAAGTPPHAPWSTGGTSTHGQFGPWKSSSCASGGMRGRGAQSEQMDHRHSGHARIGSPAFGRRPHPRTSQSPYTRPSCAVQKSRWPLQHLRMVPRSAWRRIHSGSSRQCSAATIGARRRFFELPPSSGTRSQSTTPTGDRRMIRPAMPTFWRETRSAGGPRGNFHVRRQS